jgi:hypothetical protein
MECLWPFWLKSIPGGALCAFKLFVVLSLAPWSRPGAMAVASADEKLNIKYDTGKDTTAGFSSVPEPFLGHRTLHHSRTLPPRPWSPNLTTASWVTEPCRTQPPLLWPRSLVKANSFVVSESPPTSRYWWQTTWVQRTWGQSNWCSSRDAYFRITASARARVCTSNTFGLVIAPIP